jgi:hypothetical protein
MARASFFNRVALGSRVLANRVVLEAVRSQVQVSTFSFLSQSLGWKWINNQHPLGGLVKDLMVLMM